MDTKARERVSEIGSPAPHEIRAAANYTWRIT